MVVVGEDVDLLVILIGICKADNVFFMKSEKDNVPEATYSPLVAVTSPVKEHILFLHAMSGCDKLSPFLIKEK